MSFVNEFPTGEVKVYNSQQDRIGSAVEFGDLFHSLSVVKVLRGFSCNWSRFEAIELNRYKACLDKLGVQMLAVNGEQRGAKQFSENWDGQILIDPSRTVCKSSSKLKHRSKSRIQKGGTYIITPDHRVVYFHNPRSMNDSPDIGLILYICRGWMYALRSNPLTYEPVDSYSLSTSAVLRIYPKNFLMWWRKNRVSTAL